MPASRNLARLASRRSCADCRAATSSDARCWSGDRCTGATTRTFSRQPSLFRLIMSWSVSPATVSLATTRMRHSSSGCDSVGARRGGGRSGARVQRGLGAAADERDVEDDEREDDEDGEAEPRVDDRADDDQSEVADRQQKESERVGFAAKRIPHVPVFWPLLEDVTRGVDDDPHDIDEVPVDAAQLDAVMLRRAEVA